MIKDRLYKKNTILTIPCIHMYWREPSNQFTMFLSARQNIHSVLPARIIKEHWHGIRRQRRWWSASRNRIRTSWTSTFITYEAAKGEKWGTSLFELYSRTCIYLRTQCVYMITWLGFSMYFSVWAVFSKTHLTQMSLKISEMQDVKNSHPALKKIRLTVVNSSRYYYLQIRRQDWFVACQSHY